MAVKAIQLIQIGTAMGSEEKARETIRLIKEAGYDVITPVIVCNTPQFPKMECISGMEVKAGETAIIKL